MVTIYTRKSKKFRQVGHCIHKHNAGAHSCMAANWKARHNSIRCTSRLVWDHRDNVVLHHSYYIICPGGHVEMRRFTCSFDRVCVCMEVEAQRRLVFRPRRTVSVGKHFSFEPNEKQNRRIPIRLLAINVTWKYQPRMVNRFTATWEINANRNS